MQILLSLATIFFLCFVMSKASEVLVEGIKVIGKGKVLSKFLVASIFAGLATSVPEIFVGILSAVDNNPGLAFGTAIGSNIANLGLIFSLAILLSPLIFRVHRQDFSLKTIFLLLTSSLFPFLLALDGSLSRIDGFFLICLFLVYSLYIFNKRGDEQHSGFFNFLHRLDNFLHKKEIRRTITHVLVALVILLIAGNLLVKSATILSLALGVRPYLVALFIIAPGTSLPELFVALASIKKKEIDVLYGDIFGSMVTNANLVIGLSSLTRPFLLQVYPQYLLSLFGLLAIFLVFVYFSLTKNRFEKWEAVLLFVLYLLFFLGESISF